MMPTIAEQSADIVRDLDVLRARDTEHPLLSMLAQWSAELSLKHRCQVVVTLVPVPGKPGELALLAYPLLTQYAIESQANQQAASALWPKQSNVAVNGGAP